MHLTQTKKIVRLCSIAIQKNIHCEFRLRKMASLLTQHIETDGWTSYKWSMAKCQTPTKLCMHCLCRQNVNHHQCTKKFSSRTIDSYWVSKMWVIQTHTVVSKNTNIDFLCWKQFTLFMNQTFCFLQNWFVTDNKWISCDVDQKEVNIEKFQLKFKNWEKRTHKNFSVCNWIPNCRLRV